VTLLVWHLAAQGEPPSDREKQGSTRRVVLDGRSGSARQKWSGRGTVRHVAPGSVR